MRSKTIQLFLGLTLASTLAGCPNTRGGEGGTTDRRSPNPVASPADNEGGEDDEDNERQPSTPSRRNDEGGEGDEDNERQQPTPSRRNGEEDEGGEGGEG